jgi:flagellar protein FlaG
MYSVAKEKIMSTPNINNAASSLSRGISGDSAPVVTLPKGKGAPVEAEAVVVKSAPSAENLKKMVDTANKTMDKINSKLEFTVDDTTNKTVVKVTEAQSGKVIMQFPSEEMLSITRAIDSSQHGALLKEKA